MRLLVLFTFALLLTPAASAQTLNDLAWLKGCWRTQGEGPAITEVWLAPPMPALLGYSYTQREVETNTWEQMRIEMIDGWPHFIAMPNGGALVRFRLMEDLDDVIYTDRQPDSFAAFENPEHDYPQRVVYMRFGNELVAQIGRTNGTDRITFTYRRIRCPANLRP